jgi:hypothetical protein
MGGYIGGRSLEKIINQIFGTIPPTSRTKFLGENVIEKMLAHRQALAEKPQARPSYYVRNL